MRREPSLVMGATKYTPCQPSTKVMALGHYPRRSCAADTILVLHFIKIVRSGPRTASQLDGWMAGRLVGQTHDRSSKLECWAASVGIWKGFLSYNTGCVPKIRSMLERRALTSGIRRTSQCVARTHSAPIMTSLSRLLGWFAHSVDRSLERSLDQLLGRWIA